MCHTHFCISRMSPTQSQRVPLSHSVGIPRAPGFIPVVCPVTLTPLPGHTNQTRTEHLTQGQHLVIGAGWQRQAGPFGFSVKCKQEKWERIFSLVLEGRGSHAALRGVDPIGGTSLKILLSTPELSPWGSPGPIMFLDFWQLPSPVHLCPHQRLPWPEPAWLGLCFLQSVKSQLPFTSWLLPEKNHMAGFPHVLPDSSSWPESHLTVVDTCLNVVLCSLRWGKPMPFSLSEFDQCLCPGVPVRIPCVPHEMI